MEKIELYIKKEKCCGCSACVNVCPKNAITMIEDSEGFLYPNINYDLCINCGACKRVCSFHDNYKTPELLENIGIYGIKHKSMEERMSSRSGGVFAAIAEHILGMDGVVYGAAFNEELVVEHTRITDKKDIIKLKGSKYVQSNMQDVFLRVKEDLQNNRFVLFSGTACQVAGLKSYIPSRLQEKLLVCDIVCHGVPSPKVWKDYLKMVEKKHGKRVVKADFRDKSFGWNTHFETLYFNEDGTDKETSRIYANLFCWHIMLRPSCNECHFTNFKRVSDFTLADFWGIENIAPKFNDNKGVSLLLVNTKKAEMLFEEIKSELDYICATKEACLQPNLQSPTIPAYNRKQFWRDYERYGFEYCVKKYNGIIQRVFRKLNRIKRQLVK